MSATYIGLITMSSKVQYFEVTIHYNKNYGMIKNGVVYLLDNLRMEFDSWPSGGELYAMEGRTEISKEKFEDQLDIFITKLSWLKK